MPLAESPGAPWLTEVAGVPPALFPAVADPRRQQILETLVAGPLDVSALARRCGLPRPTTMHHLGVLQRAGLVQQRHHVALVLPQGLAPLRRYFDLALTAAAISTP